MKRFSNGFYATHQVDKLWLGSVGFKSRAADPDLFKKISYPDPVRSRYA